MLKGFAALTPILLIVVLLLIAGAYFVVKNGTFLLGTSFSNSQIPPTKSNTTNRLVLPSNSLPGPILTRESIKSQTKMSDNVLQSYDYRIPTDLIYQDEGFQINIPAGWYINISDLQQDGVLLTNKDRKSLNTTGNPSFNAALPQLNRGAQSILIHWKTSESTIENYVSDLYKVSRERGEAYQQSALTLDSQKAISILGHAMGTDVLVYYVKHPTKKLIYEFDFGFDLTTNENARDQIVDSFKFI